MGIRGDMCVETVAGSVKIKDLANRTIRDPDYSEIVLVWTGQRFFVDKASQFRLVGQQQIFDVALDDGNRLSVSASSKLVMTSGRMKMPPELVPGDSLLPLYLEEDNHGYPTYRIPGRDVKRKIARLVAEWKLGRKLPRGTVVKHIDGNRKNYHPDNLRITIDENRGVKSHKNKAVRAIHMGQKALEEFATMSPRLADVVKPRRKRNHKVESVIPGLLDEVYTASVQFMGLLSVSGVFLKLPS